MLLSSELILVLLGVVFVWLIAVSFFLYRAISHYQKLTAGVTKEDLGSVLENILEEEKEIEKKIEAIIKRVEEEEKEGKFHIQKVGLVRFNPFPDTGGSHSFTLAVLDGHNNGIIISSLHSRDQTRIYTKPVREERPVGYEFSKEEKEAIEKAQKC